MKKNSKPWVRLGIIGIAVASLALTSCSSGSGGGSSEKPNSSYVPGSINKDFSGTTITVLMPPWGNLKKNLLAKFTKKTGITVDMQSLAWDSIHDKIVTAAAGGQAVADVLEMDWTWVSQFGAAGWFAPLGDYLTSKQIKGSIGASAFAYKGKQIGLPYSLDFRGTTVNLTMLKKAGITSPPKTWSELVADAKAIKDAGIVKYPIGLPLKILEGTSTPWYALVRGSGGEIFTESGKPAFGKSDVGVKALELIHTLYSQGLVDPGSIGLSDQQVGDDFGAGKSAIVLSNGPGSMNAFTDLKKSKVSSKDDLVFTHIPGMDNDTGATIGLEEALSIPKASKHKEAAAMLITWWMQTPQLIATYHDPALGLLPTTEAALDKLSSDKQLVSGDTIMKMIGTVGAVAKGGTPTWYGKFSAAAAAMIQAVALGNETAAHGIADLAKTAKSLASE